MNIFKHKHSHKFFKWLLILVAFFVFLGALALASYYTFEKKYAEKIYPGISVGGTDLSGKTQAEAREILNQKINKLNRDGIIFSFQNKQSKIFPTISSVEGDLAYDIINFDFEKSLEETFNLGRENEPITNFKTKLALLINKKQSPLYFTLNNNEILKILKSNFSQFEIVPENAKIIYNKNSFEISEEKYGNVIDYKKAIEELKNNLDYFNLSEIVLSSNIEKPSIFKDAAQGLIDDAEKILENTPLKISFEKKDALTNKVATSSWEVSKEIIASWLILEKDNSFDIPQEVLVKIGLDKSLVYDYLNELISPKVKIEPQNAKFEIKDGRVVEFQQGKDGLEINLEASLNLLNNKFLGEGEKNILLVTRELKSEIQTQDANNLGIYEIIGTGHSKFSGSSASRRHNIKTGADYLNGLIIKPEQEFSLVNSLGTFDKEGGYLPELVIKGNRTIPEYGGGLCQVGTTLFRTVVQSGLPVTMRRNHSFRVSYYEPAGTDATIYDPWPDFKFINDTANNILIQTRIEGDEVYFDFWGKKDGRIIEVSEPTIYNIVKPPPTKYIETSDLAPGVKKCTEKATNGADAYFDYKVTYSEDNVVEKRFSSHYVPWQEVCLIGVEKKEENATSTTEKIN